MGAAVRARSVGGDSIVTPVTPWEKTDAVRCQRCQGLMCPIELRDWTGSSGQEASRALRCILCGDIVDDIIVSNRIKSEDRCSDGRNGRKGRPRHVDRVTMVQ